ncbi:uncharacterized protein LOC131303536 [Rhododendron vialii]|uniref:uncharacterized protein LOC131303536 n=1 Tax=Rhododendron vialii TaxID=182163 RepID=UPI00265F4735|nr:uncharacterized protein LOC131303536 [Rhododendron vialii]
MKKSEDEEIRELIHMLVTSNPFCTREAFHRGDKSKNQWLGGTLHEWIEDYKEDVVKTLSFKAGESKFKKSRLTNVGRHIIRKNEDIIFHHSCLWTPMLTLEAFGMLQIMYLKSLKIDIFTYASIQCTRERLTLG